MKARKMGADDPAVPGDAAHRRRRTERSRNIEQFAGNRNWEENGHGTPAEDRRRGRAFDLAMDAGSTQDAFASWLPGAANINKV